MGKKGKAYDLLHEDDDLIVINKSPQVLSLPDRFSPEKPNLYHLLSERFQKIYLVHRLDKETSGIMVFAKTEAAHKSLSLQFENREVQKFYLALCEGVFLGKEGRIDKAIAPHPSIAGKMICSSKGKSALSTFKVLETFKSFSWLEVQIHTGRTHQIRVHLQSIHHPLAVDALYNRRKALMLSEFKRKSYNKPKDQIESPLMARSSLHAHKLSLIHPSSQTLFNMEAPLPKDLKATLNQLRKWGK